MPQERLDKVTENHISGKLGVGESTVRCGRNGVSKNSAFDLLHECLRFVFVLKKQKAKWQTYIMDVVHGGQGAREPHQQARRQREGPGPTSNERTSDCFQAIHDVYGACRPDSLL